VSNLPPDIFISWIFHRNIISHQMWEPLVFVQPRLVDRSPFNKSRLNCKPQVSPSFVFYGKCFNQMFVYFLLCKKHLNKINKSFLKWFTLSLFFWFRLSDSEEKKFSLAQLRCCLLGLAMFSTVGPLNSRRFEESVKQGTDDFSCGAHGTDVI